jgi:hypothetical protein
LRHRGIVLVSDETKGLLANESRTGVDAAFPLAGPAPAATDGRGFLAGDSSFGASAPFGARDAAGADVVRGDDADAALAVGSGRLAHGFVAGTSVPLFVGGSELADTRGEAAEAEVAGGEDSNGSDEELFVGPASCMFSIIGRIIIPMGEARKRRGTSRIHSGTPRSPRPSPSRIASWEKLLQFRWSRSYADPA